MKKLLVKTLILLLAPFVLSYIIYFLFKKSLLDTILCVAGLLYVAFSFFNGWSHSGLNGYNPGIMKSIKDDKTAVSGMLDLEMLVCGIILIVASMFVG